MDVPPGGMQLLARCATAANDRLLSAWLLDAGIVARPLSSVLFHKSREQGLFLGFAAWNDEEIDRATRILGRIVRRWRGAIQRSLAVGGVKSVDKSALLEFVDEG